MTVNEISEYIIEKEKLTKNLKKCKIHIGRMYMNIYSYGIIMKVEKVFSDEIKLTNEKGDKKLIISINDFLTNWRKV